MRNPTASTSRRIIRIDLKHHVQDLMKQAVSRISGGSIDVQMDADEVVLSGHVGTWHEKQFAQESIRNLAEGRVICNRVLVGQ